MALYHYLERAVESRVGHTAVVDHCGDIDYGGLDRLSGRLKDRLISIGVRPGDRVGMYLRKSIDGVATIFGVLRSGAAYVPVDPAAPASRNAYIHHDCGVRAVIIERRFADAYQEALVAMGPLPPMVILETVGGGVSLDATLDTLDRTSPAITAWVAQPRPTDLAYVLYTSGSTGKPKGVMLSHENACAFVDWCSRAFEPHQDDRFSSHAPFHFDLSILDIFVSLKHGATLVLVPEETGKDPIALAEFIERQRLSVWYSAPSILSMLAQHGKLSQRRLDCLRMVLFAGEVFPVVHLRNLQRQLSKPQYYNLYGPTETNVCTFYEIPPHIPDDRIAPFPIGRTCDHLESMIVDTDGREVPKGQEGELCIAGPNVMIGYWGKPAENARAFLEVPGQQTKWYRTGDIVVEEGEGILKYVGRRDRMIKRRGYRVELGEIEACLYRHPNVREAAVTANLDDAVGTKVIAHISSHDGTRPSIIDLKGWCARHLPLYMIPDSFVFYPILPKTSTDKIDYQSLGRAS